MANLQIKDPPVFTEQVHQIEEEEYLTAELENEIKGALLNNEVFLKVLAETIQKTVEAHTGNGTIHVTAKDKEIWSNKDGGNADMVDGYHATHFAAADHGHDGRYYTKEESNNLLNGKSNTNHNHDERYYTETEVNNLLNGRAAASHAHDERYYTEAEINTLLNGKAAASHAHDERYYTEAEVNTLLNGKAASNHSHISLSGWGDTRNTPTTPNDYNGTLKCVGIKTATGLGSSLDGSGFATVFGCRGWHDSSGGYSHEFAFTGNGNVYHRSGATTIWDKAWEKINDSYTKAEINTFLSGKAAINHNHDTRYYMIDQEDASRICMGVGINKGIVGNKSIVVGDYALPSTQITNSDKITRSVLIGNDVCEGLKNTAGFTENVIIGNDTAKNLNEDGQTRVCGYNTIIGSMAAINMEGGWFNTFLGYYTGANVDNFKKRIFERCTILGSMSAISESFTSDSIRYATTVGYGAVVTGNYQLQLGGGGTSVYAYSALNNRSDKRDKADIRDTELGLEFLLKHRPVEFRWDRRDDYFEEQKVEVEKTRTIKDEKTGKIREESYIEIEMKRFPIPKDGSKKCKRFHEGFIAQEVKAIMDEMGVDFAGYQDHSVNGGADVLTIGYTEYIPIIVKAIQELKYTYDAEIKKLKEEIFLLKNKNKKI